MRRTTITIFVAAVLGLGGCATATPSTSSERPGLVPASAVQPSGAQAWAELRNRERVETPTPTAEAVAWSELRNSERAAEAG